MGEIRALPSGRQWFFDLSEPEAAYDAIDYAVTITDEDLYFGVHSRSCESGTNDAVESCSVVFVDCDSDEAIQALDQFEPSSSFVVESGGITPSGLRKQHAYWLLSEPVDPETARIAKKRLASTLGSDGSVHDPARILRLPTSRYMKDGSGRSVRVTKAQPELRYPLCQIVDVSPADDAFTPPTSDHQAPVESAAALEALAIRAMRQIAEEGAGRNEAMFAFACQARDARIPQDDVLAAAPTLVEQINELAPGTHPYAASEIQSSIRQAYAREPRDVPRGLKDPKTGGDPVAEFELLTPSLENAKPTEFVWRNRLVCGLVNLLVGEEGAGKGTLIAWAIARLTRGELDGELFGTPARVLIIGEEDDFDRVWTPRLHVAGADLDMISAVKGNNGATLTFPSGLPKLRTLISTFGADLVYADQLLDNLDPEINPDAAKDVRRALMPLRVLAGEMGICVVAALHTNKARGGSFRQSVSGSHAFNAVSRSSLLVAPHPDGPEERRVLAHGKGSYVKRATSLEFTIESRSPKIGDHVIQTSVAVGFKDCPLSADDLLAPKKTEPTSKAGRARAYIRDALADGENHDAAPIIAHLRDELEMHERQIRRAADDLDVISERKAEFQGGATWRLPLRTPFRPSEKFTRTSRNGRNGDQDIAAKPANAATSDEDAR